VFDSYGSEKFSDFQIAQTGAEKCGHFELAQTFECQQSINRADLQSAQLDEILDLQRVFKDFIIISALNMKIWIFNLSWL
jgi:hypothetical protein